jgi:uncharacterized membrane protein
MSTELTASDARQLIAIHDPLLARSLTDDQALAVIQALNDARWSGTVSGAFWLFVVALLGYYGLKWADKNTNILRL